MLSTIGVPRSPCLPISGLIGISPKISFWNSSAVFLTPPSPKILYFFPSSPIKKLIKGENVSVEDSGLSKREWNELMESFDLKDKII